MNKHMHIDRTIGKPIPLGVSVTPEGLQFAVAFDQATSCELHIYKTGTTQPILTFDLSEENHCRMGDVFFCTLSGNDVCKLMDGTYEYTYLVNGEERMDPYARHVRGRDQWGVTPEGALHAGIASVQYNWKDETRKIIPYHEMILYQLHVRGFTKHTSSGVKHKGTFLGITEKLSYLKQLGVNALLLLPCYDFEELIKQENPELSTFIQDKYRSAMQQSGQTIEKKSQISPRLNYWGYAKDAFYYAPKSSYASVPQQACEEMKDMVRACHREGMEVLMDFFFAPGTDSGMILDCLRYWVIEYHVDGFRLNQDVVPESLVCTDPILRDTKLLATHWEGRDEKRGRYLADCNDGFLVDCRKYLKGDEGQVQRFIGRIREQSSNIHYLTNYNGFTLLDLVSYDVKHNEANGEQNVDGTQYNYSWNCGYEGATRRRVIVNSRMRQIKNGLLMLLLSQGTPMLLAGDEMGNTQAGNNNAYCQDNEIGWVVWKSGVVEKEILHFTKELIALRKKHPVFHQERTLMGMDTISCGMPDISFHGMKAWFHDDAIYNRLLGVLLSGQYVKNASHEPDEDFYLAFNMHWEEHKFSLPTPRGGMHWEVCMCGSKETPVISESSTGTSVQMSARTVAVFISIKNQDNRRKIQSGSVAPKFL